MSFHHGWRVQSWFLESLDRRVVQCREKMGSVYEVTLGQRASQQQALVPAAPAAEEDRPPMSMPPPPTSMRSAPRTHGGYGGGTGGSGGVTPRTAAASYVGLVDGGDSDDFED